MAILAPSEARLITKAGAQLHRLKIEGNMSNVTFWSLKTTVQHNPHCVYAESLNPITAPESCLWALQTEEVRWRIPLPFDCE